MKRNKITTGKLANTIEIRKPVTLREWEKVRGKKATALCATLKADGTAEVKKVTVPVYRYTPTNTATGTVVFGRGGAGGSCQRTDASTSIPADPTDEEVLLLAKHNIARLEPKFREGMRKYSTPIFQKSGLKEMLPEIIDLVSYHAVAQLQWSKVYRCLDDLCEAKPELNKHPLVVKMFEILGDKPLAVKKKEKKVRKLRAPKEPLPDIN